MEGIKHEFTVKVEYIGTISSTEAKEAVQKHINEHPYLKWQGIKHLESSLVTLKY